MWNRDERKADYITQPSLALVDTATVAEKRGEGRLTITGVSWLFMRGLVQSLYGVHLPCPSRLCYGISLDISRQCGLQGIKGPDGVAGHNGIHAHLDWTESLPPTPSSTSSVPEA